MRAVLVAILVALSVPAIAQTAAPTSPASAQSAPRSARGGDITKDEYIERAVERARRAAEKRFDRLDLNHDGVLTANERRAAREDRAQRRSSRSQ